MADPLCPRTSIEFHPTVHVPVPVVPEPRYVLSPERPV